MFIDTRRGGVPIHWITQPKDLYMRIPDYLLNCVAFFGRQVQRKNGSSKIELGGTGFVLQFPIPDMDMAWGYLVTARHNILDLGDEKYDIRINRKDGMKQDYLIDPKQHRWYFHPTEEDKVDVAICEWEIEGYAATRSVLQKQLLTDEQIKDFYIGPGDEIFLIGLFHPTNNPMKNTPVVRVGNVATVDPEIIATAKIGDYEGPIEAYLIDTRTIHGFSGSPVFVRETIEHANMSVRGAAGGTRRTSLFSQGDYHLLGLVHGHIVVSDEDDEEKEEHAGISTVVPARKILEVLNHPKLVERREVERLEVIKARAKSSVPD
jgi:hypothetical protein